MPLTLSNETLDYLLQSAGLTLTDAEKAELKSIHDGLTAMKARVRQPRGHMAELAHTLRLYARRTSHEHAHPRHRRSRDADRRRRNCRRSN